MSSPGKKEEEVEEKKAEGRERLGSFRAPFSLTPAETRVPGSVPSPKPGHRAPRGNSRGAEKLVLVHRVGPAASLHLSPQGSALAPGFRGGSISKEEAGPLSSSLFPASTRLHAAAAMPLGLSNRDYIYPEAVGIMVRPEIAPVTFT